MEHEEKFFSGEIIRADGSRNFVEAVNTRTVYHKGGINVDLCKLSDGRFAVVDTRSAKSVTRYFHSESAAVKYCKSAGLYK